MKQERVVFRVWRDTGEPIAFFPDQNEGHGMVGSYQHVGQHGAAAYPNNTRPAEPHEYAALAKELHAIGYSDLRIVRRVAR